MIRKIVSKTTVIIIIALAAFVSGDISNQIREQCPELPSQYAFIASTLIPTTIPCITRIIAINLFGFLTFFIPLISLYFWIKPKKETKHE